MVPSVKPAGLRPSRPKPAATTAIPASMIAVTATTCATVMPSSSPGARLRARHDVVNSSPSPIGEGSRMVWPGTGAGRLP